VFVDVGAPVRITRNLGLQPVNIPELGRRRLVRRAAGKIILKILRRLMLPMTEKTGRVRLVDQHPYAKGSTFVRRPAFRREPAPYRTSYESLCYPPAANGAAERERNARRGGCGSGDIVSAVPREWERR
jgi:hypothetical protein